MKKRIIAMLAIIAVLGLAIAAVAYARSTTADLGESSCCKKDSCPMKKADHEKSGEHVKGEHHNCCGDSCPMKKKGDKAQMSTVSLSDHKDAATADGCCGCCGDSCPMKKDNEAKTTATSMTESGKSCCDNCDCCKGKGKHEAHF